MGKINIMSENLSNKISAGEVVEKAASVVKELVENSIDALANDIKVELINGGLNGIKVIDNGIGMDKDDALLAFQRHATSKLLREDDLFFIDTLGFRGEALPSIAAVSEVDLTTSTGGVGTHIKIKGGKLLVNENSDSLIGTKIEVKNLNGHKKISDIFIEKKIPKYKRNNYPIVVDSKNNILWIPGLKKSKFSKEKTEKYDIIIKCEAR